MSIRTIAIVLLFVFSATTLLVTSCNDGAEQDMYAQMMQGRSGSSNTSKSSNNSKPVTTDTKEAKPGDTGLPGQTAEKPEGTGLPGQDPSADPNQEEQQDEPVEEVDPTLVADLVLEKFEVKAPYPEFTGKDRYDIDVLLYTTEYHEPAVYRIVARNEEGENVGDIELKLKLPLEKARAFKFPDFYCQQMPSTLTFHTTEKGASAADEGEEDSDSAGGGGRRSGGGNGSSTGTSGLNN